MIDSVEGMISAPPTPIATRAAIRWLTSVATARRATSHAEDDKPDLQRPRPAEAVAEGAHRQQQPGEDEDVGIDDPLELGGRAPKVRWIVGRATLRTVLSSPMSTRLRQSTPRVHQRRA